MSFQQGLSGLNAASKSLEVIGNNVSNANTVGFKQSTTKFEMYMPTHFRVVAVRKLVLVQKSLKCNKPLHKGISPVPIIHSISPSMAADSFV